MHILDDTHMASPYELAYHLPSLIIPRRTDVFVRITTVDFPGCSTIVHHQQNETDTDSYALLSALKETKEQYYRLYRYASLNNEAFRKILKK